MQRMEKIPARAPRKAGDEANVTYRLVRRQRTQAQQARRMARRLVARLKGRA